jgi:DNA-binding PadR family transcriptional regulator
LNRERTGVEAFLPLTPAVLHILLALADGDRHGYEIMRVVEAASEGRVKMGPSTLYGSIPRMLAAGLIARVEREEQSGGEDPRRRYYTLTGLGKTVLAAEVARLAGVVEVARRKALLSDNRTG